MPVIPLILLISLLFLLSILLVIVLRFLWPRPRDVRRIAKRAGTTAPAYKSSEHLAARPGGRPRYETIYDYELDGGIYQFHTIFKGQPGPEQLTVYWLKSRPDRPVGPHEFRCRPLEVLAILGPALLGLALLAYLLCRLAGRWIAG